MKTRRSAAAAGVLAFVVCFAIPRSAAPAEIASAPTVSVATDRAVAQAINLTSTDLPGWQVSPNPPTAGDQSFNSKISACAGGPSPQSIDVIDVSSANFSQGPIELNSDVTMVKTHNDGLADLRASSGHKALSCFSRIFPTFFKQELPGASLSNFKVSDFKPTETEPGAFGIQFSATVSVKEQGRKATALRIAGREIAFLVGAAEVTFGEDFTGSPKPVANEASLVQILYQRAIQNQSS